MSLKHYLKNQETIASKEQSYNEPKRGVRRIETDKSFNAYLNANELTDAEREDLIEQYYDQGFIEVDE